MLSGQWLRKNSCSLPAQLSIDSPNVPLEVECKTEKLKKHSFISLFYGGLGRYLLSISISLCCLFWYRTYLPRDLGTSATSRESGRELQSLALNLLVECQVAYSDPIRRLKPSQVQMLDASVCALSNTIPTAPTHTPTHPYLSTKLA